MAYPNRYTKSLTCINDIEFSPLAWYILTIQLVISPLQSNVYSIYIYGYNQTLTR